MMSVRCTISLSIEYFDLCHDAWFEAEYNTRNAAEDVSLV